ncbi:GGDEF domain-containing protein [Hydrogenobacter hydrogenophilus]|uniref:diguanylate cyclase n=1 Tax=Hydrogenobacter hydrogenophilus TaxID=35835 RepID=A0A285NZM1_9AQUI|nr:GGDEF domain-containing protein [Hydrogenobacter hydrogenophilus]SNZ14477.1 diguanylate cyclase (GGDEF) domain-containing protein [Hydrogenobacter hydrogenophilus]
MEYVFYILLGFSLITFAFFMRSLIILLVGFCITSVYFFIHESVYLNMFMYTVLSMALLLQGYKIRKLSKGKLTLKDPLTGVYSRLFFEEYVREEIKKAYRFGKKFAILFIDLNDFKAINDAYGHHIGDHALKTIASKIKDNLRECDIVSRWGGDEFAIILPETSCNDILEITYKLYNNVNYSIGTTKITLSIGYACYPEHGHTLNDLLQEADKSMYKAKMVHREVKKGLRQ